MIRLLVVLQNLLVKRVTERKLFLHKKQVASVRSFRLEEEKGPRMLTLPSPDVKKSPISKQEKGKDLTAPIAICPEKQNYTKMTSRDT